MCHFISPTLLKLIFFFWGPGSIALNQQIHKNEKHGKIMMITRKCVATVLFYFVATGLKCFMKLHKCVGHLLNYGAQVFPLLVFHISIFFFGFWVAAGRCCIAVFIKRLGNCPTGRPVGRSQAFCGSVYTSGFWLGFVVLVKYLRRRKESSSLITMEISPAGKAFCALLLPSNVYVFFI